MVSLFWENTVLFTLDHHTAHVPHTDKMPAKQFCKNKIDTTCEHLHLIFITKNENLESFKNFSKAHIQTTGHTCMY